MHQVSPSWGTKAVISHATGVIARAFLVVLLIATPSLLLPTVSSDVAQVVALAAILAAGLVIFEYTATYPGLIEFRDAPPFNRIRFGAMFISVFLVSVICRSQIDPNVPNSFVAAVGMLMGHVMDFPYSPVHLFLLMLPDDTPGQTVNITRSAAGLAYVVSIASIAAFSIVLRLYNWPLRNGNFNVWVNLPTFDPTTGGDVVERLLRAARVNLLLGFLLPFLFPAGVTFLTSMVDTLTFENSHTLIWTVTAWALLPASLFMRGIAVQRIAHLICEQRRQTEAFIADTGLQPV